MTTRTTTTRPRAPKPRRASGGIAVSPAGVTAEFMDVTPEMAQDLLDQNTNNRNVRRSRIEVLRKDIREGRWVLDCNPIRLGGDLLYDGQHRLIAQVEEGATLEYLVCRNLNPAAKIVIDSGAKRTVADNLAMAGFKSAVRVAAAVNYLHMLDTLPDDRRPHTWTQAGASTSEAMDYCLNHPEVEDAASALKGKIVKPLGPPATVAAFVHMARVDPADAEEFFRLLSHPDEGISDVPGIHRLWLTLQRSPADLTVPDNKLRGLVHIGLIWRAWNDYRLQAPISTLAYRFKHANAWLPLPDVLW